MCGQGSCLLQAEKNMAWEAQQQQAQAQAQLNALQSQQGTGPCKLLVANINIRIEVGKPCCANSWWQVLVGARQPSPGWDVTRSLALVVTAARGSPMC